MKKKLAFAGLIMISAFTLAGCSSDVTLTEEQNDMIAEYVAGSLLKHSYENEWKYSKLNNPVYNKNTPAATKASTSTSQSKPQQTTTSQGATTASTAAGQTTAKSTSSSTTTASSISQALGLNGVTVSYKNISIGDRYPTEEYAICVPADSGCKVVAVEFTIKNTGSSDYTATTKSSDVSMKLQMPGGTYTQYKSMLKNDICNLDKISIKAGGEYTVAAVFQVPKDSAVDSGDIKLEVLAGSQAVETIDLK